MARGQQTRFRSVSGPGPESGPLGLDVLRCDLDTNPPPRVGGRTWRSAAGHRQPSRDRLGVTLPEAGQQVFAHLVCVGFVPAKVGQPTSSRGWGRKPASASQPQHEALVREAATALCSAEAQGPASASVGHVFVCGLPCSLLNRELCEGRQGSPAGGANCTFTRDFISMEAAQALTWRPASPDPDLAHTCSPTRARPHVLVHMCLSMRAHPHVLTHACTLGRSRGWSCAVPTSQLTQSSSQPCEWTCSWTILQGRALATVRLGPGCLLQVVGGEAGFEPGQSSPKSVSSPPCSAAPVS